MTLNLSDCQHNPSFILPAALGDIKKFSTEQLTEGVNSAACEVPGRLSCSGVTCQFVLAKRS